MTVNLQPPEHLGYYIPAPDENINEHTICQRYVYQDGRDTGMRMLANLPIAQAFTTRSGMQAHTISPNFEPNQCHHQYFQELPPSYLTTLLNILDTRQEEPPPSYDVCMRKITNIDSSSDESSIDDSSSIETCERCRSLRHQYEYQSALQSLQTDI